jgi:hypothetical protein
MIDTWEIWLDDPQGVRILSISPISFSVAKVANKIGAFSLTLGGNFNTNPFKLDGLIEFWRNGQWINTGMLRNFEYWQDNEGTDYITISGPDTIDILQRRIERFQAGQVYSDKTDYADDMMKEIVDEHFGSSAGTGRDLSDYISVAPDASLGYSLSKGIAYRNVYDLLIEIAETSRENDLPIYFDLVPYLSSANQIKFRFETYLYQPGIDRTTISDQVVFGTNYDNISEPHLEYDFTEEVSMVLGGGAGEGTNRYTVFVMDNERVQESPYNRREAFADVRNGYPNVLTDDKAAQEVRAGRPVVRFSGTLKDIPPTRYGIEWNWGDRIIMQYRDIQAEAVVSAVVFKVDSSGKETIDARFALDDFKSYGGRLAVSQAPQTTQIPGRGIGDPPHG